MERPAPMQRSLQVLLLGGLLAAVIAVPVPASAATFTVTSALDAPDAVPGNGICATVAGECTLRAAIQEANSVAGSDRIIVPAMAIILGSRLQITSPIELFGAGADRTIVDANRKDLVFLINSGPVTLEALTVRGGVGGIQVRAGTVQINDARITDNIREIGGGGGVFVASGATVRVRRTTIDGNVGAGAGSGGAGGIANVGTLLVRESLIGGNPVASRDEVGPGTGNGSNRTGGIWNAPGAILSLTNTTVSGNVGDARDAATGGIVNNGFAFLNNVTLTNNKGRGNVLGSFRGGGLLSGSGATTVVQNTIIANNDGRGGPHDCAGALSSTSRYNLIGSTTGCTLPPREMPPNPDTFILNQSPQLGPLADNGGPTRTHLPATTSPVIDAGSPFPPGGPAANACEATDQRGIPRLLCDMGAVELEVVVPADLTVSSTADLVDVRPGNGICATVSGSCSLRAAIQEANRLPGAQTITVPPGVYDLAIPPAHESGLDPAAAGDLDLLDSVAVRGANPTTVIVDGNDLSRVFDVAPGTTATVRRMTIRDGTDSGGGGVRVLSASLTLGSAIVEDNESTSIGGGIEVSGLDSTLDVSRSLIRNNRSPFFGGHGGGIDGVGDITIDFSTISGNEASGSGGGLSASGVVIVRQSTIANNRATGSLFGNGGGISASGLVLRRSTVSGNTAAAQGGGVFGSGSIVNSTISGNTSATKGGGVSTSGSLSLRHVTIAGNTATGGGSGLHRVHSGSVLLLRNTVLANAPGTECADLPPTSEGNNIASDASCGLAASGDRQATNALLGPLADNGGFTRTHLPLPGSPAIDAAANTGLIVDQRGVPRPQGPSPDIGSVERA